MPTPYGTRGGMAFGAGELRVLRRALALALHPSSATVQDVQDCHRLAESLDDTARESSRFRAFLLADLARYRAALPGGARGYLAVLSDALDAAYRPVTDDFTALRALRGTPGATALLERSRAVVAGCGRDRRDGRTLLPTARTGRVPADGIAAGRIRTVRVPVAAPTVPVPARSASFPHGPSGATPAATAPAATAPPAPSVPCAASSASSSSASCAVSASVAVPSSRRRLLALPGGLASGDAPEPEPGQEGAPAPEQTPEPEPAQEPAPESEPAPRQEPEPRPPGRPVPTPAEVFPPKRRPAPGGKPSSAAPGRLCEAVPQVPAGPAGAAAERRPRRLAAG